MQITLSKSILDNFDMKNSNFLVEKKYYLLKPGRQEYRLYSYLATFFNNTTILDIGTCKGTSAISLAHNPTNKVLTYDIINEIRNKEHICYKIPNVTFKIRNVLFDLNKDMIKNVKLIVIDIDHNGTVEANILQRLRDIEFKGIVLLDDIHHPTKELRDPMQKLWNNISEKKYDVTQYGHWSGTGIILFDSDITINIE